MTDRDFMALALQEAQKAYEEGEVPVGACLVKNGEVLCLTHNQRQHSGNPLHHAEVMALQKAGERCGKWNMSECTLYVTLEPCPMCAGAIIQCRLGRLVYGARDAEGGAVGSVCDLTHMPFSHNLAVQSGVLADECKALLQKFFAEKRV